MSDAAIVFLFVWLALALYLAIRIRAGASATLRAAPPRQSSLSLVAAGMFVLLYLFSVTAVAGVAQVFGVNVFEAPASMPVAATQVTSAPSPPETAPAPLTGPATGVATGPERGPETAPEKVAASQAVSTSTAPVLPSKEVRDREFALNVVDAGGRLLMLMIGLATVPFFFPQGFRGIGLHRSQFLPGFLKGLLAFVIIFPFLIVISYVAEDVLTRFEVVPETHQILQSLKASPPVLQKIAFVVIAVVVAPLTEEFLFRGVLQSAMIQHGYGLLIPQFSPPAVRVKEHRASVSQRWYAIVVASLLFAAVHLPYSTTFPIIFPLALALGYVYERTGSLWAPIALHAAFNGMNIYQFLAE